jgi:hypothetical protein
MAMQERLIPLVEYRVFHGLDNQTRDDMRLKPGYLRVATNVDIDEEDMAHRREGILRQIAAGSWSSLWTDGGSICLGVKNGSLTQINLDWSTTTLLSVGTSPMAYVKIDDRVFYSNGPSLVGYIKDGATHAFPEPDRSLRQKMVGGSLLEYYNGRLYAAQGNVIYCSVAYSPMEMDLKRNFMYLGGPITMMNAVKDGLYISAGSHVSFHHGSDLFEMKYVELLDVPAHRGSAQVVERLKHTAGSLKDQERGKCVIFSTPIGIFMGEEGGVLRDLTGDHYAVEEAEEGASTIRWYGNYRQFLYAIRIPSQDVGATGSDVLPMPSGTGN